MIQRFVLKLLHRTVPSLIHIAAVRQFPDNNYCVKCGVGHARDRAPIIGRWNMYMHVHYLELIIY